MQTRADVALAGTFGYELDVTKMSEEDKEEMKKQIAEYHKYYDVIHFGELYRLIPPNGEECAWCYVSEDKSEALLTFVCVSCHPKTRHRVKFRGLDPNKTYQDQDGTVHSGSVWMNAGINYMPPMQDHTTFKIHLTEIK